MKQLFINENDRVWSIEVKGKSLTISYGDLHGATYGNLKIYTKKFDSEEKCNEEKAKLIDSKCKKGYEKIGVSMGGVSFKFLLNLHNIKKGHTNKLETGLDDEISSVLLQEIFSLSNLEELSTTSQKLTQKVDRLINLKRLKLEGDEVVTALPETLTNLKNLGYLELYQDRKTTRLPETIGHFSSLKELRLSAVSELNEIPQCIGKLEQLEVLHIENCKGANYYREEGLRLPDSLGHLVNLKKLTIESCNLNEITTGIGNLSALEELDLNFNKLKNLPDTIGNLQKLTKLNIALNRFEHIPNGVYKLHKLVKLDISDNDLQKIETSLLNLKNLERFSYSYSKITNIPENVLESSLSTLKDFLLNGPKPEVIIKVPPVPENAEVLVSERRKQVDGVFHDINKDLYQDPIRNKLKAIKAFIFGETNELPKGTRPEIYSFKPIATLFNPIDKWNFIDQRLFAFICNGTFLYQDVKFNSGYNEYFFRGWYVQQLKKEQKGEDTFGKIIEALNIYQMNKWTALTGYLNATYLKPESFHRKDGSVNSVGAEILKCLKEDRKKTITLLKETRYFEPLIPLLAKNHELLDDLLEELLPYYEGELAKRHLYRKRLEELCKIDAIRYEAIVLEKMQGSDCLVCIMECYRILLTYIGDSYKEQAVAHAKKLLKDITTRKNEDLEKKHDSNWSTFTQYYGHGTLVYIQWICEHLGKAMKTELFTYVEDTKELNIDIVSAIVQCFGQEALMVAMEALKMDKQDNSAVSHYRQAFTLLEDLDYSAYYNDVWDIACSRYPDLADLACMSLANRPVTDIFDTAVAFLSSKKKEERRAGTFVLSQLGSPKAIASLEPIITSEKVEEIRNHAVRAYYTSSSENDVTIADMQERITLAIKRGKLKKPVTKWLDTLPKLAWHNGTPLTQEEQYYLFYRQSSCKSINPDIEAAPMYTLLDKKQGAEVAFATFQYIHKNTKFNAAAKNAFSLIGKLGDKRLIELLKDIAIKDKNLNVCAILGVFGTHEAALALDQIAQHFHLKYPNVRGAAEEAFEAIATQLQLTYFELKDNMLPHFNIVDGYRKLEVMDSIYTMSITPELKFAYTNDKGKKVKSISKAPVPIKTMLKEQNATLRQTVKQYSKSLDYYLVTQRIWPGDNWVQHVIKHPVAFAFSQSLIWQCNEKTTFIVLSDGNLLDETGNVFNLGDHDRIRLAHPLNLDNDIKNYWRKYLEKAKLKQLVMQLDRELATPEGVQMDTVRSRNLEGKTLDSATFKYRAKQKGWRRGSIGDGGGILSYRKAFEEAGIEVFIETENIAVQFDFDMDVIMGKYYFTPYGSIQVNDFWNSEPSEDNDERLIAFKDVPPIVFSESINDLEDILKSDN